MQVTLEELESFSRFASQRLRQNAVPSSLEECLRQWRAERELQATVADIEQSLDDVAPGRVNPVDQVFDDVRRRLGWRA